MEQQTDTIKRSGYIYSKGTKAGFLRMQRMGIPRPLFSIEDKLHKILTAKYKKALKEILEDFKRQAKTAGLKIHSGELTKDGEAETWNDLIAFFEEMARQEKEAQDAQKAAELKSSVNAISANLESEWNDDDDTDDVIDLEAEHELADILLKNQQDYQRRLEEDAPDMMMNIIKSFSIDKQKLYNDNMSELRRLYLDNSVRRAKYDKNALKRKFLEALNDYVTGQTDTLDIKDIAGKLLNDTSRMARFFARDQLARFNKATTLATFQSAGVTKVKWVTAHDVRVRESHRALDGSVFDINNLPKEVDDYNCRCGLIPVLYAD